MILDDVWESNTAGSVLVRKLEGSSLSLASVLSLVLGPTLDFIRNRH